MLKNKLEVRVLTRLVDLAQKNAENAIFVSHWLVARLRRARGLPPEDQDPTPLYAPSLTPCGCWLPAPDGSGIVKVVVGYPHAGACVLSPEATAAVDWKRGS